MNGKNDFSEKKKKRDESVCGCDGRANTSVYLVMSKDNHGKKISILEEVEYETDIIDRLNVWK